MDTVAASMTCLLDPRALLLAVGLSLIGCSAAPSETPPERMDAGAVDVVEKDSSHRRDAGVGEAARDAADAATEASTPVHVKWHPGHYGLTYGPILGYGDDINTSEIASLSGKSAIAGYKAYVYWAAVDLGPVTFNASVGGATSGVLTSTTTSGGGGAGQSLADGVYWFAFSDGSYRKVTLAGSACSWTDTLEAGDIAKAYVYQFSQIDQQLSMLETMLDVPRHYALSVLPGSFTGSTIGSGVLPNYIITDPAMGPSPTSGSYGWWGGHGNGNTATAALHRSAVSDRWIALVQALGAYYDSEPFFEAFIVQEDAWAEGALSTNGCPDYSNGPFIANMKSFLSAAVTAFPHTNVVEQNSWVGVATDAQELEAWMTSNRVAPANADTWGQSRITAEGIANGLPWGVSAYAGTLAPGSSWSPVYDMRPLIRYMPDVEAPDMGLFGTIGGGPFTPADLMSALNETLEASHVFWTMIPDGTTGILAPNDGGQVWWTNLTTFLAGQPLTHVEYPSVYP
jgi:hypothetical protein